ncbi:DESI2 [Symbiodinium natans]|uniref:DESI2 protein n=1 Tax=Symbiodinium natans TaxID=878477 RepID=A0A812IE74_9DINO|nr:DESI2 [Symbiodinium natans]
MTPDPPDPEASNSTSRFRRRVISSEDVLSSLPGELEPSEDTAVPLEEFVDNDDTVPSSLQRRRARAATDGPLPPNSRRLKDTRARRSVAFAPFEVSSSMLRKAPTEGKSPPESRMKASVVTLRIYDVTGAEVISGLNRLCRAIGTGAFHAGVEVYGAEWSFGYTDDGGSGVFSCDPGECGDHAYREAVTMGVTCLREEDVMLHLSALAQDWQGQPGFLEAWAGSRVESRCADIGAHTNFSSSSSATRAKCWDWLSRKWTRCDSLPILWSCRPQPATPQSDKNQGMGVWVQGGGLEQQQRQQQQQQQHHQQQKTTTSGRSYYASVALRI